jgi:hypothetical protein
VTHPIKPHADDASMWRAKYNGAVSACNKAYARLDEAESQRDEYKRLLEGALVDKARLEQRIDRLTERRTGFVGR